MQSLMNRISRALSVSANWLLDTHSDNNSVGYLDESIRRLSKQQHILMESGGKLLGQRLTAKRLMDEATVASDVLDKQTERKLRQGDRTEAAKLQRQFNAKQSEIDAHNQLLTTIDTQGEEVARLYDYVAAELAHAQEKRLVLASLTTQEQAIKATVRVVDEVHSLGFQESDLSAYVEKGKQRVEAALGQLEARRQRHLLTEPYSYDADFIEGQLNERAGT